MDPAKPLATRIRLKTSCTECQKRRKKCNRAKPCSNCTRRYPPVECVYEQKPQCSSKKGTSALALPLVVEPQNKDPVLAAPGDDVNTLPALSTLNLPHGGRLGPTILSTGKANTFANIVAQEQSPSALLGSNSSTSLASPTPYTLSYGFLNMLRNLHIDATPSNAELFQLYFKGILPSLWSIDGSYPAPPVINEFWIPFMTSSPIIVHANLLRAAIFRAGCQPKALLPSSDRASNPMLGLETKDQLEILTLKSKAISLLNARLRSPGGISVDDEAIVSVIFFFYNEWCWGVRDSFSDLNPHARGLQEMVKIRGGIRNIDSHGGFLAKFIMLTNYHLAIILERELFICPSTDHDYCFVPGYISTETDIDSPLYRPIRLSLDGLWDWGVDSVTAIILEQVCELIATIRSYMFEEISDVKCKDLIAEAEKIQAKLVLLPSLGLVDRTTPIESLIYECCHLTAVVYYRAILNYIPFSSACGLKDLDRLYSAMNLVPNTRWKQIQGVYLWIVCAVNPAARYRQEGLKLRLLLKNATSSVGLVDWQMLLNCMESFMAVQRWIRHLGSRCAIPIPASGSDQQLVLSHGPSIS